MAYGYLGETPKTIGDHQRDLGDVNNKTMGILHSPKRSTVNGNRSVG